MLSGGGDRLEVYLGGPIHRYAKRNERIKLPTQGLLRSADLEGDGLLDLLVFDPFTTDAPVQLLHNLGTLPGSPPRVHAPHPTPAP